MEQADPQRGGVDGPVVDGRQGVHLRRRPVVIGLAADLVEHLAGLLARPGVGRPALTTSQGLEGAESEIGAEREQHAGGPDRVPAEQG